MSDAAEPGSETLPRAVTGGVSAPGTPLRVEIRFTGSGSEYFRIWIVNLLLIIVTATLYVPWAKVRRLRYFYGNTLVDDQPLGFHARPVTLLRGYLLVGAMALAYAVASRLSPTAALVSFLLIAAIAPALLKASMQFRLANTSWRGLRLRFTGTTAGAYRAVLPGFAFGALLLGAGIFVAEEEAPPMWFGLLSAGGGLLVLLAIPWLWWMLKKYQHDHLALGALQTQLRCGPGAFYLVFLKAFLFAVVVGIGVGALTAWGVVSWLRWGVGGAPLPWSIWAPIAAVFGGLVAVIVGFGMAMPFYRSRMQNLLWSRTGNRMMHFNSALRFWPLLLLTSKNSLLIVLTLGLYWPFAAIAMARLKLEAMSVTSRIEPQALVDRARPAERDATGEAAGDLFGIDIGF